MPEHSQLDFSTCPSSPSLTSNQSIRNWPRTHKNYSSLLTCNGFNRSLKEWIFEVSIFTAFKAHTVFKLPSMRKENWIATLLYSSSLNLESKINSVSYLPETRICGVPDFKCSLVWRTLLERKITAGRKSEDGPTPSLKPIFFCTSMIFSWTI